MDGLELPTISVCIPMRNGAAQLPLSLRNLARTSYPSTRFELLIGDHGSNDESARIAAGFREEFEALRVVPVAYTGPNRALVRNQLIQRAQGDLLVFLDHDVLTPSDFLLEHARLHAQNPGALIAGLTYGKGFFRQEIDTFVSSLQLEDIQQALPQLEANPALGDLRVGPSMLDQPGRLLDARKVLAPFRFFWTCNLSARRRDIEECGVFDEAYASWGVEDDDFAHQFYARGKHLLFSRDAWAFHLPHPVSTWRNIVTWRKNLEHLFRKFRTRELECYSIFVREIDAGVRRMTGLVGMLAALDHSQTIEHASARLAPCTGRRSCHFVFAAEAAQRLGVTDALCPNAPLQEGVQEQAHTRFWPQFGLSTPFRDQEIDEALLLVDVAMLLDRHQLSALLIETARFARQVVLCYGPRSRDADYGFAREAFDSLVELIRFGSLRCIDRDVPSGEARQSSLA